MQSPQQLIMLCDLLYKTRYCGGGVVEVGCAYGWTTVFLNRYLSELKSEKKYFALDTFKGFESSDINFEKEKRMKEHEDYSEFQANSKRWFDETMRINGIRRVTSFKVDVKKFDFSNLGSISFCLIDVDIYKPTKIALEKVWPLLSPGGVIIVDDCIPNYYYDGSLQAYSEFIKENNLSEQIVNNFGIIQKTNKNAV